MIKFEEVIEKCKNFIDAPEQNESAFNDMLNSLKIQTYLPLQDKVVSLVVMSIDSDKELHVPSSMFTSGLEIACLFDGLLTYTNIENPTDISLKNYENYDLIYQSGLADYILSFCEKDYERLVRMMDRTLSYENLLELIDTAKGIDVKELSKIKVELQETLDKADPELVKNMADIMRYNDPNMERLKKQLDDISVDEAFEKKTEEPKN